MSNEGKVRDDRSPVAAEPCDVVGSDREIPLQRAGATAAPAASGMLPATLTFSAGTRAGLTALAAQLDERLATEGHVDVHALARTLADEPVLEHRAVVVGRDRAEVRAGLAAVATGGDAERVLIGRASSGGKTAMLLTGQGSQRVGMGAELYAAHPVFAAAFDEVCAALDQHVDRPLRDVVFGAWSASEAELLDQTGYAQPALFAFETALFRLLDECGVTPDFLIGHSLGEVTAAHVAGVLSLPDAAELVAARARLMQAARCDGVMLSIQASEAELRPFLKGRDRQMSVAALNGPAATVVSGDEDAVRRVGNLFAGQGRRVKELRTSHAFHSAHMDGVLAEFRSVLDHLRFGAARIPIVSNVTGDVATAELLASPDYWVEHVRGPVRFLDGIRRLREHDVTTYLEVGPGAVLTTLTRQILDDGDDRVAPLPLLRADQPDVDSVTTTLAAAHVRGVSVDWARWLGAAPAVAVTS